MRSVPIRRRLYLLVAAGVLPLAVMSVVALRALYVDQRAQSERAALEIARALASAVDGELRRSVSALEIIASLPAIDAHDLPDLHNRLERAIGTQPHWRRIILAELGGQQILNTAYPVAATLPTTAEPASLRQVAESGRPSIGSLVKPRGSDWMIPVRVPVVREERTRYVLTAAVDPESLRALLDRQRVPAGWVVAVIDGAGQRVARSRAQDTTIGTPVSPTLRELMARGPEGFGPTRSTEGNEVFTAYTRLPNGSWSIAVGIPREVLEAGARESYLALATGLALSILAGLLAALFIARSVSRPMAELEAAARSLGRGERPLPPETDVREIREVADALFASDAELLQAEAEREDLLRSERVARAEAEAANRAKDEFLAMLGHELRNPLGAISNAAQLLDMANAPEARQREARAIIARQVSHLRRLTDDLLDAGRALMGKIVLQRVPLDLAAVTSQVLATLWASGRTRTHQVIEVLAPAWVEADAIRLDQVISNLVINAAKYTPAGRRITVMVAREGGEAVLRVLDEGIGIPEPLRSRVFDLFVQGDRDLDRSLGGLGIGLTLVKRLAQMHGGTVAVTSEGDGKGSEFTVRLPAIEPPARSQVGAIAPVAATGRDILVIEDNEDARETLTMLLEIQGHRVSGAADGDEGLAMALANRPEVMLVDVGLPKMDGYEVARRVRADTGWARRPLMVAVTGYGQPEDRARALAAGFDEHLAKPVEADVLGEILARGATSP